MFLFQGFPVHFVLKIVSFSLQEFQGGWFDLFKL
jgi:hypothetical protein